MALSEEFPYYIVEFVKKGKKPKTKCIEIVAFKWLRHDAKKDQIFTFYPDENVEEYEDILKNLEDAPSTWKLYHVKAIGRAVDYDTAISKCTELQTKENILSLESGEDQEDAQKRLNHDIKRQHLNAAANNLENMFKENSLSKNLKLQKSDLDKQKKNMINKIQPFQEISNFNDDVNLESGSEKQMFDPSLSGCYTTKNSNKAETQNSFQTTKSVRQNTVEATPKIDDNFKKLIDCLAELKTEVQIIKTDTNFLKTESQFIKSCLMTMNKMPNKYIGTISQINEKYQIKFPITKIETFLKIDSSLDKNESLKNDIINVAQTGLDSQGVVSKSLINILKLFVSKDVATKFVAERNVQNKYVFKKTNFFNLIQALIIEHSPATTEKNITAALSKVLSNSVNWFKKKADKADGEVLFSLNLPVINAKELSNTEDDPYNEDESDNEDSDVE